MATLDDAAFLRRTSLDSWAGYVVFAGSAPSVEPSEARQGHEDFIRDRPAELRVRPIALSDVPDAAALSGAMRLDLPDSLVHSGRGLADVRAALPVLRRDRPTFVATADDRAVGVVRFSPRRPDGRWVISSIAASTGVYSPEPVWEALLGHGVRAAGLKGVRRLFARVPVGHALIETMRQSGWVPYAREAVFRADRFTPVSGSARDLRLQEPADTWAIHQLYAASVPRQIQEVEALTSHFWHMDPPKRIRRGLRQTGWLLEESGLLAGYARYTRGPRAGMIDVVVEPGQRTSFGILLDGALAGRQRGRERPIYCAIRGYSIDFSDQLIARGFSVIGEQELLIRYTTVTARRAPFDAVHFPVELRPAMPRRVPTFLEGQPTDGTI